MSVPFFAERPSRSAEAEAADAAKLLNALPHPIVAIRPDGTIANANAAAEVFFGMSRAALRQHRLAQLVGVDSPLHGLIAQVRAQEAVINEYRFNLNLMKPRQDRLVDVFLAPLQDPEDGIALMLQERFLSEKMSRQLTYRDAGRSVAAIASVLAHEVKNPLSGIRGAAQLLENDATDEDRALTRLICDETDRIVKLVDRMSAFSEGRVTEREKINIHSVLDHVKKVSQAGFARHIRFIENYDPSLPAVLGNRDQLIQIFLNLVKNAAEAIGESRGDGTIEFSTAFRPGVRLQIAGSKAPVSLPLEFCVRDNGCGVPPDLLPYLYDPFVTTKVTGTGLGLALVAKIIGDHGGTIECESAFRRTTFRILMPMYVAPDGKGTKRGRGW
ncbi:MAG TPA: ATP-binding protein [Methylocella sp.]|nr:ATP-binding protein [Methylocella sp.]